MTRCLLVFAITKKHTFMIKKANKKKLKTKKKKKENWNIIFK